MIQEVNDHVLLVRAPPGHDRGLGRARMSRTLMNCSRGGARKCNGTAGVELLASSATIGVSDASQAAMSSTKMVGMKFLEYLVAVVPMLEAFKVFGINDECG